MDGVLDFAKFLVGREHLAETAADVRKLKTTVSQLAKNLEDDAKRIQSGFATIRAAVQDIQAKNGALNIVSAEDRKLVQDLTRDLEDLRRKKADFKKAEQDQAAVQKTVETATRQVTSALKQQQDALRAAVAANDIEAAKKYALQLVDTKSKTEQLSRAVRGAVSEFTAVKGSYNNLTIETNKLREQLRGLDTGFDKNSESASKLKKQIADNTQKLTEFDKEINQSFRNVGNYPTLAAKAGIAAEGLVQSFAGAYYGIQGVATALKAVFDANVQFSDAAADVRKTTGLTADEFDNLAASLKRIDTRTSLSGLLDIAKVGGQLGYTKDQILDFVKSMDVANQALGDDFSGGAEQIATELGKISIVFKRELGPDVAQNLLAIGSAVNEIGAEGAATAPFLTDVALRVGAVAAASGVGLKNVFAYAAVLEETGFTSERASTALNRLFSTLSTKTEESFRIAQKANPALTLKEFSHLVNTDFNAAIQIFLKGLNAGAKSTTEQAALLKTLKLQSGEAKNVIITLAQNTQLFAERQATANEQLRDANSLSEEAKIKNDNLAASSEKLGNQYTNFFTSGGGGRLIKFFIDLNREVGVLALVTGVFDAIGEGVDKVKQKFGLASAEQKDYTLSIVSNTQALQKQAGATQKLLDSYTALSTATSLSSAQELELAQLRNKLAVEFGTTEATEIQKRIDLQKTQAASNKVGLEQDLFRYNDYIADTQKRTAKLQEDAVQAQLAFKKRFNLDAEGQRNLQDAAASNAFLNQLTGRNFPKEQIEAAKELNRTQAALTASTTLLAKEQQKRGFIVAALKKLTDAPAQVRSDDDAADAADAEIAVFDKAAKARARLRKQDLENQLAEQQRIISETKKFQDEQGRLFEAKVINEQVYGEAVIGTQDTILTAERNTAVIRENIAKANRDVAVAQVAEELNAVRRKKKVSHAELLDAEEAYNLSLGEINLKYAAERLKVQQDYRDKLLEYSKRIDIKPVVVDPAALTKAETQLDISNERGLKRMQDRSTKEKAIYDKRVADEIKAYDQKTNRILFGLDTVDQAQQMLFDAGAERNAKAIEREERSRDVQLQAAGDNEELKVRIQEQSDARIAALKTKQAKADQRAALFSIALNTAAGVTSVLRTGGGTYYADLGVSAAILSGIVIATGAAQAAAVLAKGIPQYFKGREGGPAEFAQVAERGPEIIEGRSGGMRLVEKPSVTFLNEGDKVYTAQKTKVILQAAERGDMGLPIASRSFALASQQLSTPGAQDVSMAALTAATAASTEKIVQAIQGIPRTGIIGSKFGFEEVIHQHNHMTRLVNKRLKR